MLKIGITGGIGCGKSLVSNMFSQLGVPVFDADSTAKSIMQEDSLVREALISEFGPDIYFPDRTLNRKKLSAIVFKNPSALKALNAITHPATIEAAASWMRQMAKNNPAPLYVIKEAALLFEADTAGLLDAVIGVYADREKRIRRVMRRDQVTRQQVEERMARQMEETKKMLLCDWVLDNNESTLLWPQVLRCHAYFSVGSGDPGC